MEPGSARRRRIRRWAWASFTLLVAASAVGAAVYGLIHAESLRDLPREPESAGRAPDRARPVPVPGLGDKLVGVNVHPLREGVDPGDYGAMFDLVERSGSNVVRVDVGWASLEPVRSGLLDPGYTGRADAFMRAARARGIPVIVTLAATPCWASSAPESRRQGCAGRWYERGVTAWSPRDPRDYARIAATLARRWRDSVVAVEVWNEPNEEFFFRSREPARDYGRMLRAAYRAIKDASPHTTVVGGSLAYADGQFLRRLYSEGRIAGHYDAISFHPYTNGALPTAPRRRGESPKLSFRDGTRWMRRIMSRGGDARPQLWLTEFGASTCNPDLGGPICVTERRQARYVSEAVRLGRRWEVIGAVVVYSLTDDGEDRGDPVHGYGLSDPDGNPKPAFEAFRRAALER